MSRGPGHVQRAILNLIATPEAMASYNGNDEPGPVGVPLAAVFDVVYGTISPTRAQRVAVHRAIRKLNIDTYQRRACLLTPWLVADAELNETGWQYTCCDYLHPLAPAIGRPRTDDENEARQQRFALAIAMARG